MNPKIIEALLALSQVSTKDLESIRETVDVVLKMRGGEKPSAAPIARTCKRCGGKGHIAKTCKEELHTDGRILS